MHCNGIKGLVGLGMPLFILLYSYSVYAEVEQVPGVIHIDALAPGEGKLSIPDAVRLVSRANLGVAVISPHDISEVSYGIPPLRNLLKISKAQESIQTFGPDQYLAAVTATDKNTPDVVTIAGTEAIPGYFWDGSIWNRPVIRNMHKHMLVIGLTEPEDYESIPSIANGFSAVFGVACFLHAWPIGVLLLGSILMVHSKRISTWEQPRSIRPGAVLAIAGVVFCINGFPFCQSYDAYHGDPGTGPYQATIDYANDRNALTFWAHPEVNQRVSLPTPWPASMFTDSVYFETLPYTDDLLQTDGYTGFAIFEEGTYVVGRPGGIWDQTLIEYCAGVREKPVWAIAEVDFEPGHADHGISTSQTVFWLEERTHEGVLNALKTGTMYARRGIGNGITINEFRVSGIDGEQVAHSGGHMTLSTSPTITIDLDTGDMENLTLQIIRSGKVIETTQITGNVAVSLEDQILGGEGTTFYRFTILNGDWPILASNPIFVTIRTASDQGALLDSEVDA